jgi:hypothetical protein
MNDGKYDSTRNDASMKESTNAERILEKRDVCYQYLGKDGFWHWHHGCRMRMKEDGSYSSCSPDCEVCARESDIQPRS